MPPRPSAQNDRSNGWDAVASDFMAGRHQSIIGVATVRAWGRLLPGGASILDLGCGSGVPIAQALMGDGFVVSGVDASPALVGAFRSRFPNAHVACESVERSRFFDKAFDGILAIGLLFLLPAEAQCDLIRRVALALNPRGRFLFTSPVQSCGWPDLMTGRPSLSLGADEYRSVLSAAGLTLAAEYSDEGDNHYYDAFRSSRRRH